MPDNSQSKKLLIIYILQILQKYTDEKNTLSQKQILDYLEKNYAMRVDRKAVNRNLDSLADAGYKIEYSERKRLNSDGSVTIVRENWYLERDFTDAELRLLIDSVIFSKHIPHKHCRELISKIASLSNEKFSSRVKHISSPPERTPQNKELFYIIEILDEAINEKKQVEFSYVDYGTDKKRHPRKSADKAVKKYVVNPYQIVATSGRYYLICNNKKHDNIGNFRLDRITGIKMLSDKSREMSEIKGMGKGFDFKKHVTEHIYMFGGECSKVTFLSDKKILNDIIDWFGTDVDFYDEKEEMVTVRVNVNIEAMFYWAMQYGNHVEIIKPEKLRKKISDTIREMEIKYCKNK